MHLNLVWRSQSPPRDTGEIAGERSRLLRTRLKRPSRNNQALTLGSRVYYMDEPGRIIAINIAALGRWPAHLYPFIVQLDCGLVVRAHAMDMEADTACPTDRGTGKPESTLWY